MHALEGADAPTGPDLRPRGQEDAVHVGMPGVPAVHAGRRRRPAQLEHDARVGDDHHVADPRVGAVAQRGGNLAPEVGAPARQDVPAPGPVVDVVAHRARPRRAPGDEQIGAGSADDGAHAAQVGDRAQVDRRPGRGHAVVREQHDRDRAAVGQRVDAVEEPAEGGVDLLHRLGHRGRRGAGAVPGAVDRREVQGDEVGPPPGRQDQPVEHLVDPLAARSAVGVAGPEGGPHPPDVRLGADEQHRRRHHALRLGGDPDGLAAVPGPVLDVPAVAVAVLVAADGVVEAVAHQAVALGMEAGGDGVVGGERQRRIRGNERVGDHPPGRDPVEGRRGVEVQVVVAEPVERHQHHVGLVEGLRGVDAAGAVRGRGAARLHRLDRPRRMSGADARPRSGARETVRHDGGQQHRPQTRRAPSSGRGPSTRSIPVRHGGSRAVGNGRVAVQRLNR